MPSSTNQTGPSSASAPLSRPESFTLRGVAGFVSHCFVPGSDRAPWFSRHHRRRTRPQGVGAASQWRQDLGWLVAPHRLNWWISILFIVGSICFAGASFLQSMPTVLTLSDSYEQHLNRVYFVGSIPFSCAAGLQLWQSANASAPPHAPHRRPMQFPGYKPKDIGWLSSALQFLGTLLFNISTLAGALTGLSVLALQVWVWVPNFVGSVLFLASGLLGYAEVTHSWTAVFPKKLSWWVVAINLLGCVGFMVSAIAAFVFDSGDALDGTLAALTTLSGALCFLLGALLMLPESATTQDGA